MLSGIEKKYDLRHIKNIERKQKQAQAECTFLSVQSYVLNDLFEQYNVDHIDYLSVDTEGGVLDILKMVDFDRYYIYAISVENNYNNLQIRTFLESKGFKRCMRLHVDEIYINAKSRP